MSEDGKSQEHELVQEIINPSSVPMFTKSDFIDTSQFNVDLCFNLDFSMLKAILSYLLESDKTHRQFRKDIVFRMDILKNRVDQLVLENESRKKEHEQFKNFREEIRETLERDRSRYELTDKRLGKLETQLTELDNFMLSNTFGQNVANKDELLKLISSKAERSMDDK